MSKKTNGVLISTLLSSVMMVEGMVFFSQPKVTMQQSLGFNLQVSTPKSQLPVAEPQAAEIQEPQAQPKEESLQLELLGTAIGNTKDPIAFIKNLENNKQGIYRLGSKIKDAEIIKIVLGEVVLERNGKQETLKMSKRAKDWARTDDAAVALSISISGDIITVSRSGILNETGRILSVLPVLKFKPYIEGKKATGLMVTGVSEDSIVKEVGIQNKDIIKTVNGQTINSYQQALQVAGKLRNQTEINVSVLRRGEIKNLSYRLTQ